jgi:hypothetical protein
MPIFKQNLNQLWKKLKPNEIKNLIWDKEEILFKPFIWIFASTKKKEYNLLYICVIEANF